MCIDFMPKPAADGSSLSARTLEFGVVMTAGGIVRKAGTAFTSPSPASADGGLCWKSKYGYVGCYVQDMQSLAESFSAPYLLTLNNQKFLMDGMNEAGLSCGGLWLPQTHYLSELPEKDNRKALYYLYFSDWVLGTCSTVEDVKSAFNRTEIRMWADGKTGAGMPIHYIVYDRKGNGVVIEHVDGICHVHDNPYLVCTNAPTFDWQKTNVMNYVGLTNEASENLIIDTGFTDTETGQTTVRTVSPTGHGSGLRGIPGDYTPPSRLIRTLMLKNYADQAGDADALCTQALHILNNTDITLGTALGDIAGDNDFTQMALIRDFSRKRYYFRTYDNQQLHMVDLGKALQRSTDEPLLFNISGDTDLYKEVTPKSSSPTLAHAAQ